MSGTQWVVLALLAPSWPMVLWAAGKGGSGSVAPRREGGPPGQQTQIGQGITYGPALACAAALAPGQKRYCFLQAPLLLSSLVGCGKQVRLQSWLWSLTSAVSMPLQGTPWVSFPSRTHSWVSLHSEMLANHPQGLE